MAFQYQVPAVLKVTPEESVTDLPFFFNDPATAEIYALSLPDALPISTVPPAAVVVAVVAPLSAEVSWTVVPTATLNRPAQVGPALAWKSLVAMLGAFLSTTRVSLQAEVAPRLLSSPA